MTKQNMLVQVYGWLGKVGVYRQGHQIHYSQRRKYFSKKFSSHFHKHESEFSPKNIFASSLRSRNNTGPDKAHLGKKIGFTSQSSLALGQFWLCIISPSCRVAMCTVHTTHSTVYAVSKGPKMGLFTGRFSGPCALSQRH